MKPGDHPEFFRFPAPEGRSRESTISVDRSGVWHHDGEVVEHQRLKRAMQSWVRRHPDDGRYILSNGYDWTYFTVEDVPFVVDSIRIERDQSHVTLLLDDGTEELWQPEQSRVGDGEAMYTVVKRAAIGGPFEARFSRHAQASLASLLEIDAESHLGVRLGGLGGLGGSFVRIAR
ncbi:hypothetical protein BH09MYX1_BH09MYX1_39780 [soil metagenome]